MQACRGGAITDPRHHRAMAAALARRSPQDLASLKMYPPQERIGELEARYTAQLPPAQVIQLFERYLRRRRPLLCPPLARPAMNDLILSLAMAALGQFASLGGGFGPVLGGGLGYGGAPGGAGTTGGGERARQVVTVAVVRCLVEEGRLDPGQAATCSATRPSAGAGRGMGTARLPLAGGANDPPRRRLRPPHGAAAGRFRRQRFRLRLRRHRERSERRDSGWRPIAEPGGSDAVRGLTPCWAPQWRPLSRSDAGPRRADAAGWTSRLRRWATPRTFCRHPGAAGGTQQPVSDPGIARRVLEPRIEPHGAQPSAPGLVGLAVAAAEGLASLFSTGFWSLPLALLEALTLKLFLDRLNNGRRNADNGRIILADIGFWLLLGGPLLLAAAGSAAGDRKPRRTHHRRGHGPAARLQHHPGFTLFLGVKQCFPARNGVRGISIRGLSMSVVLLAIALPTVTVSTLLRRRGNGTCRWRRR